MRTSIWYMVAAPRLLTPGKPVAGEMVVAGLVVMLLAALSVGVASAQDDAAPTFASAEVVENGQRVEVTFSENIGPPDLLRTVARLVDLELGYFYGAVMDVEVDGERVYVKDAELDESTLKIPLEVTITPGAVVRVAYDNIFARDAVGLFVDDADNALQTFSWQSVTNNSTASVESTEEPGTTLAISATELEVTEGGVAATYTVKLSAEPSEEVTVYIEPELDAYGKLTLEPETLTFTEEDWDSPQTVSVSGSKDDDEINYWVVLEHDSTLDMSATLFAHVLVLMVEGEDEEG